MSKSSNEQRADAVRMEFILTNPEEAASAMVSARAAWDADPETWAEMLRDHIDAAIRRS